nr:reverse transcriptase domain-containing protein [Tanacetum cinerariifolium]
MSNHEQSAPSQPTSAVRNTVGRGKEPRSLTGKKKKSEKLKELKARLNFDGCSGTSRYSESKSVTPRNAKKDTDLGAPVAQELVYSHESDWRWALEVEIKKKKSSGEEDDLSQPWVCKETDPFTPRIRYFDFPTTRMPSHIKTYDGSEDPDDHLKIFLAAAKTERDVKGVPDCMRIFGFVHGITNPELIKRLHDKIPKTIDEVIRVTTSFLRGEVAASNHKRKKTFPQRKQHESIQKQTLKKERNHAKFCEFHGEVRHNTDECMRLRKQIEEMLKAGKLSHLIKEIKQNNGKEQPKVTKKGETSGKDKALAILMVQPWERVARQRITQSFSPNPKIFFPPLGEDEGTEGPMIIEAEIECHCVHRMYVDGGSASKIMYDHCFSRLQPEIKKLIPATTPLTGFSGEIIWPIGNAGATNQRLVDKAFYKQIGRNLEVYANDLVIKSRTEDEIVRDIKETFKTLREINMKLNPKKCAFGVEEGMFLWYKVNAKGLKVCPDKMKQLIAELLMLTAPMKREELIVYLAATKETASAILMTKREAKQMPIYFVSRALRGPKLNYTSMEKRILLHRWFRSRTNTHKPKGMEFTYSLRFRFDATNNEAEYEALIAGLRIAEQMGVKKLQATVDSRLVANQVNGTYIAKEADMICYLEKVKALTGSFKAFSIKQTPRSENKKADALSKIASTSFAHLSKQVLVEELKEKSISEVEILAVLVEEGDTWMTPLFKYLAEGTLPADVKKARAIRRKSWRFAVINETLYKKYFLGPWLRCVGPLQTNYVLREIHEGSCSMHAGERIKARLDARSKNWIEELPHVLWAHRTMIKSSNGDSPFSLTYETDAVIPTEIGMPTLRTVEVDLVGNNEALEINLDLLEERREDATIRESKSKAKMEKYYNSKFLVDILGYFQINLSQLSVIAVVKMDLFAFINHVDPAKVRIREREVGVEEVPLLQLTKDRVVSLVVEEIDHAIQGEGVNIVRAKGEIQAIVAEKPKYRWNVPCRIHKLFEQSTLNVEVGVTAVTTVRFVTSFVTLTSECEEGGHTDSVTGPNLCTQRATERCVVLSDSSHHSSTNVADDEVTSIIRSCMLPHPILTMAVATTIIADATSAPMPGAELSTDLFFVSQDVDSETLHQTYIPKWNVTNEYALNDPDICCGVIDHLAPSALFSQLRKIASLKAQLSLREAEVAEAIRLHGKISNVGAAKAAWVNELTGLKKRNSALEEEKHALKNKVAVLESVDAAKGTELASLTAQAVKLTQDLSELGISCDELSIKASSFVVERDRLVGQVSLLKGTCLGLRDEVMGYKLFKDQIEAVQDEQVKVLSDKVAELDVDLMRMALHLDEELVVMKCLQSPKYLAALGGAIGRAIDKGMQDGLAADIDHGKVGKGLTDVVAYDPSAEANYISSMSALHAVDFPLLAQLESHKDASMSDLMDLLCLEGPAAQTPESSPLQPSRVQLMLPIHRLEDQLLSAENLAGEASTFGFPAPATTTALSTTFILTSSVPPIPMADDIVLDAEQPTGFPSPSRIVFEDEELETTPEHTTTKNSTDYNKAKDPIPFRRLVFSSDLDGRPIRGKDVGLLIESDVFKKLDDNDAVILCCVGILQLVLLGVEDRHVDLGVFSTDDYYTHYRRHPRIVAWSLKHKFYRHMLKPMLHGQLPVERLVPDETEARSRWWVSSRAYFDERSFEDEQIPHHLNRNNYFEVPSEMYREFEEHIRGCQQMKEKNYDMYEKMTRFMEDMRWVPEANTTPIIADQHFGGVSSSFHTLSNNSSFFNMATIKLANTKSVKLVVSVKLANT